MQKEIFQRLSRIDQLIRIKGTGTPSELAGKIGISERSLYDYLKILKEMGAPVKFSRNRGTYYYNEEGRFRISFISKGVEEHLGELISMSN